MKGSAGGKATAIILRQKSIDDYYLNPNYCLYCNKLIEVDHQQVAIIRKKKFCNKSCAASFNGKEFPKRKKQNKNIIKIPKIRENLTLLRTKGELFKNRTCWQSARSAIQKSARTVYFNSSQNKTCLICNYEKHIEVAHIKSVASFPDNTLISEINSLENLVALCPNHHWEFDNGHLKL